MKAAVLKISTVMLLAGALCWACQKENEPPVQAVSVPKWDVKQPRTLEYAVVFKGYTKGQLAQERNTILTLTFEGAGVVVAHFDDATEKQAFKMDSTGALTPLEPGEPYSPILDLLAQIPPEGLKEATVGNNWDVLTPTAQRVQANPDVCIIQSRRNFKVLSADAGLVRMEHSGYLRVVDNKAATANFEAMFGTAGGALARAAWTSWRQFQTGETVFSTTQNCLKEASYVAVILPGPNMNPAALRASPEREELTIRIRP